MRDVELYIMLVSFFITAPHQMRDFTGPGQMRSSRYSGGGGGGRYGGGGGGGRYNRDRPRYRS